MNDDPIWTAVRHELEAQRRSGFAPGFDDRAVARWRRDREPAAVDFVVRLGRRVLFAGAAAAVVLATYALRGGGRLDGQSAIEALLGLTPVTVDAVYLGTLPGAQ